jgi:hypothetical protein
MRARPGMVKSPGMLKGHDGEHLLAREGHDLKRTTSPDPQADAIKTRNPHSAAAVTSLGALGVLRPLPKTMPGKNYARQPASGRVTKSSVQGQLGQAWRPSRVAGRRPT